jgi:hypothetical protein
MLYVLPESECHSSYLGTMETRPTGFIEHKTVVILGESAWLKVVKFTVTQYVAIAIQQLLICKELNGQVRFSPFIVYKSTSLKSSQCKGFPELCLYHVCRFALQDCCIYLI